MESAVEFTNESDPLRANRSALGLERLGPAKRARIDLMHGSLVYRDKRLADFDAAAVIEVIEHLDPTRLGAFTRVLFEYARPRGVVLTTPNAEYNVRFETLPAGKLRHHDHRFEWSRAELERWAANVALRHRYSVRFLPVGPLDPELGAPTQMAIFERQDGAPSSGASGTAGTAEGA
jgi:3' terminal RNA ribose 2'-O-methyltransferase Hen1